MGQQLLADHVLEIEILARAAGQHGLGPRQGAEAPVEVSRKIVEVAAGVDRPRGDRAHYGQDILHPVLQLGHQQPLAFLGPAAITDVAQED